MHCGVIIKKQTQFDFTLSLEEKLFNDRCFRGWKYGNMNKKFINARSQKKVMMDETVIEKLDEFHFKINGRSCRIKSVVEA